MNDIVKQERQKLHMAADNMRQMIQVLLDRDKKHFLWAWQQLENNLEVVRGCFIGATKEHRAKIEQLFDDHKDLFELKDELTAKLYKKLRIDHLSDSEIEKYTNKFIEFLREMTLQFKLAEFGE